MDLTFQFNAVDANLQWDKKQRFYTSQDKDGVMVNPKKGVLNREVDKWPYFREFKTSSRGAANAIRKHFAKNTKKCFVFCQQLVDVKVARGLDANGFPTDSAYQTVIMVEKVKGKFKVSQYDPHEPQSQITPRNSTVELANALGINADKIISCYPGNQAIETDCVQRSYDFVCRAQTVGIRTVSEAKRTYRFNRLTKKAVK